MRFNLIVLLSLLITTIQAKEDVERTSYSNAFYKIESMLSNKVSINFKKAVFLTEDAYFNNGNYILVSGFCC